MGFASSLALGGGGSGWPDGGLLDTSNYSISFREDEGVQSRLTSRILSTCHLEELFDVLNLLGLFHQQLPLYRDLGR